jgi:hypothetical protein
MAPTRPGRGHRGPARTLSRDPLTAGGDKGFGIAFDAPAWKCDAQRAIGQHTQDVAAGAAMPHEDHGQRWDWRVIRERQSQLHGGLR